MKVLLVELQALPVQALVVQALVAMAFPAQVALEGQVLEALACPEVAALA
tara:strand:- start:415 stop:564 length:150 start_codon:yes stop_codon:yes gene_type:complete